MRNFTGEYEEVDEMARQAKEVLTAKSDDASSIPGSHKVEEENRIPKNRPLTSTHAPP